MGRQGYSAAERLERLPISGYHRIIFIIIALAFFFDSMDRVWPEHGPGRVAGQFEFFRHGGGRFAVRDAC